MAGRARALVAAALGLALAAESVALYLAQQGESASYDEPELLYSGVRSWKLGDFSISPHPPLTKLMAALPVWLILDPDLPPDPGDHGNVPPIRTGWNEGKLFLNENTKPGADATSMLRLARLSPLVMWVILVLAVAGWSWELYGPRAALVSAGLAMSCPVALASGQILSTDVGGASFATLGAWLFARALHRPTTGRFAWAGLAYGLALGARYQPLALFAASGALALALGWRGGHDPDPDRLAPRLEGVKTALRGVIAATLAALATLLALYRVDSIAHYPYAIHFLSTRLGPGGAIPFFLDGETSRLGWIAYFPRALLYKLPPPHVIAIGLALASLCRRRPHRAEWMVIVPAAVLFALAMASRINYGVRHVLPVLPALYVLVGRLVAPRPVGTSPSVRAAALVALLPLAGLAEQVRSHPHYPPYISPVFGGSSTGYRRLADGNVDAGQSLVYLARDLEAHPGGVLLALHGNGDPAHHGIPYRYLAGYFDQRRLDREPPGVPFPPRYVAVSATFVQLYGVAGASGAFHFLLGTPPDRQPGYAILVWDLEARPAWYGPLAGVLLETSLSRNWSPEQQTTLAGRATALLRAMRARDPEGVAATLAWLDGRVAILGSVYGPELVFKMAAALGDSGFHGEARVLFGGVVEGRFGPVDPLLVKLARDNLLRLRGR